MDINFIYEISDWKYFIWTKKWNKILNKKYYFQNLINLDIENNTELYIDDINFKFQIKKFIYNNPKKIGIKDIEDNLKDFWEITWYIILNIFKNWEKSNFILWESWEITYDIWTYTIKKEVYNKILKNFWKNINLKIFPNSLFLVKEIWENIEKGSILYLLKNTTKLINIEKWFYKNIEKLDIWIDFFLKNIKNIFWTYINNINNISEFNKRVYKKELSKFLEPIILFLKNNLKNKTIYIIWDFKHTPLLLETLWNNLNTNIIPVKINNKTFKNIEQVDIYCILKNKFHK